MSVASRIEEMYQHVDAVYNVLELAGKDLTNVDKNLVNLTYTWRERLLYFMNNGTDEVWNNWNKVNGSGTSLSLRNTEEAPMSLTYKGNTSQEGTPTPETPQDIHVVSGDNSIEVVGKNLINLQATQLKRENATYSNITVSNNTLSFEVTGSRSGYVGYIIPTTIGQTYTLSFNLTKGFIYTIELDNVISDISGNFGLERTTPYTYTATKQYLGVWLSGGNTTDNQASVSNLMLEKSNQATTYEEYKGASYPITLPEGMFLGWIPNTNYYDKIDKSSGKNLYNGELELGSINPANGNLVSDNSRSRSINFVKVKPNTTYSISKNVNSIMWVVGYTSSKIGIVDGGNTPETSGQASALLALGASINSGTFTTTSTTEYIKVYFTTSNSLTTNIMLNEGSTALPYEPYGTGWYLKKEIGKVVLNGSEDWSLYKSGSSNWFYYTSIGVLKENGGGLSNLYPYTQITSSNEAKGFYPTSSTIRVRYGTEDTIANYKNFLSSNNLIAYYVLATPTYETITDITLIGQLEALKKSYESVTNISQVNNDLPFELSVTALEVMS